MCCRNAPLLLRRRRAQYCCFLPRHERRYHGAVNALVEKYGRALAPAGVTRVSRREWRHLVWLPERAATKDSKAVPAHWGQQCVEYLRFDTGPVDAATGAPTLLAPAQAAGFGAQGGAAVAMTAIDTVDAVA
jgi:hypothetical protein